MTYKEIFIFIHIIQAFIAQYLYQQPFYTKKDLNSSVTNSITWVYIPLALI